MAAGNAIEKPFDHPVTAPSGGYDPNAYGRYFLLQNIKDQNDDLIIPYLEVLHFHRGATFSSWFDYFSLDFGGTAIKADSGINDLSIAFSSLTALINFAPFDSLWHSNGGSVPITDGNATFPLSGDGPYYIVGDNGGSTQGSVEFHRGIAPMQNIGLDDDDTYSPTDRAIYYADPGTSLETWSRTDDGVVFDGTDYANFPAVFIHSGVFNDGTYRVPCWMRLHMPFLTYAKSSSLQSGRTPPATNLLPFSDGELIYLGY